ncbi:helix-turn-helix domain-containing protein [Sphaerisporangium corydalis]|uniref:Helix-turn-helix domain-containing protein n=1 Tax=Sphaerisporangium corydalis TaxID=1441875 RepID=A0ABV9EH46_9ACTN|nr:helix-turn-helix transcriptional regulator [Sphaerisporangium corydalis]
MNGIGNTGRSRRLRPLSDDLPEPTRILLRELRALKERAGFDLRALEQVTHASRSSWGRWLAGDTWIPLDAVEGLARLCREDEGRFRELWEAAEQARRLAGFPEGVPDGVPAGVSGSLSGGVSGGVPGGVSDAVAPPVGQASGSDTLIEMKEGTTDETTGVIAPRGPAGRSRRRFLVGAVLGLAVGLTAGIVLSITLSGGSAPATGGASVHAVRTKAPKPVIVAVDRAGVIARARTWRPATGRRVPYSQVKKHDGYRTDGSGYASMALELPRPGPNTISLATPNFSRPIKMTELLQGDLVIDPVGGNTARAVVIFDRWADAGHTSYWAYQQRAGYGTDYRIVDHGLKPGGQFRAYRPVNLRDGAAARSTPTAG